MLKRYLINFIYTLCIVFTCICVLGAIIFLIEGEMLTACLFGLGLATTLSGAITLNETHDVHW